MSKDEFYQMRVHRDVFESRKIERDSNIYFKVIGNNNPLHLRDNLSDIEFLCRSIKYKLSDWNGIPTMDKCLERLNTISSMILFFHKDFNKAIGWSWFSDTFTHNWVDTVNELPHSDSNYLGGVYLQKNLNPPPNAGFQIYYQSFSYLLSKNQWLYGYADNWNRASKINCHKLGVSESKFIKE